MIYEWGSRSYAVPAQVVGEEIERIEQADGVVCTPRAVVDAARDETAVLHSLFEWDDERAAEEYRVEQARRIVSSIRVVRESSSVPAPAFVHVRREEGTEGYRSIQVALEDPADRKFVLQEARNALAAARKIYGSLEEFSKVWDAIDDTIQPTKKRHPRRRKRVKV